jgi:beta-adrenergic-receptor kinase
MHTATPPPPVSPEYVRFCQWKYLELYQTETINPDDFTIHRIIGRGGFGEVYGCRKDDSGRMFAMKCLDKKRIKLRHGEDLVFNERNILTQVNSAFVVNLHYAFQTSDKLYLIMDLMNGGDLHYHLTQQGVFNEDAVRFYTAEIILGLEHLHKLEIVYRDLKPSNILLDEEGHVRISDLGLAQKFSKRFPSSSVGTHGYMAPEVIKKGVQYSYTADWFSLGCVIHKLLLGHSPFRGSHVKKDDIDSVTLTREVVLPDHCSPEIQELIIGLLCKDPDQRLACKGRGSEELKELPFFKSIDWLQALNCKLVPPMVPSRGQVNAAETFDIGSFSDDDVRGVKLSEEDQKKFKSFNVVVPHKWQSEMMDTIFETVNADKDKVTKKEQQKYTKSGIAPYSSKSRNGCVLEGYGHKLVTTLLSFWQRRYFKLYQGRIEWGDAPYAMGKNSGLIPFDRSILMQSVSTKGNPSIQILPVGTKKDITIKFDSKIEHDIWLEKLKEAAHYSDQLLERGPKAIRKISTEESMLTRPRELRHTHSVPPTTTFASGNH